MTRRQGQALHKNRNYIQGNTVKRAETAPDIKRRRIQEDKRKKRVSVETRRNRQRAMSMNLGYVLLLSFAAVIMFAVCAEYLHLKINLTNRVNNIAGLESKLQDMTSENDELANKINASVDLEHVKKVAIEELGMIYPSKEQIVIYKDSNSDYMNQYENIPKKESTNLASVLD
ncbi:cell division protein FtsL [Anaerosacchariphilus polymeriproducens]|uniref:Cell division protein FtsL n=1 Tax=Anaerosacchariphilus polymeriproducens TaxID=1812858 RepID=A0A371B0D8_9FIRM|nr:cell division protein FtsL [Anaerosacchariphilus polymeriproducens]RDU25271.1 cell division protein FtsL [Anaerosacchariphilus polymeriproducens]